jgi:hypothetical protein
MAETFILLMSCLGFMAIFLVFVYIYLNPSTFSYLIGLLKGNTQQTSPPPLPGPPPFSPGPPPPSNQQKQQQQQQQQQSTPTGIQAIPESQVPPGTWNKALFTRYSSYPNCCNKSPNYDPKADKSECSDYSGCKYMGQFANDSTLSLDQVRSQNIISPFSLDSQFKDWASTFKNKKLYIKNPQNGNILVATAIDTCKDSDCSGCCSRSAREGGGTFIDLESSPGGDSTAARFYGGESNIQDTIQGYWKFA